MTYQPRPGDIGLSGVKAQGVVSLAIKLGSVLRREDRHNVARMLFLGVPAVMALAGAVVGGLLAALAAVAVGVVLAVALIVLYAAVLGFRSTVKTWFSHSFIVHHVDADGTVWITEAHASGVHTVRLHYRLGDYVWLRTSTLLAGEDEVEMRAFLDAVTAARWRYDYGTFAGLAVFCICGAMLVPPTIGTAVCSGLTSEGLQRGRAIWPVPAYRMLPQDQYWFAQEHGIRVMNT